MKRFFVLPVFAAVAFLSVEVWAAGLPTGRVIKVGGASPLKTVASAAQLARDGDTIEIEDGDYPGDVLVVARNNLTLRARNGKVRIDAAGKSAEGKATWVIRASNVVVEGITFLNSRVSDGNGAGIRFESGSLTVRRCSFLNNENGILTANNPSAELVIEDSEFGHNGAGDGQTHNLYAGTIGKLAVTGSYFHHARIGHLLKSRARENHILYNRLTDEKGGTASYELEFPAGGIAYVIGNSIEQAEDTDNPTLVSYGAEGYKWPTNDLVLAHNTIVNDRREGGRFLFVRPGQVSVQLSNNILVGKGSIEVPQATGSGNVNLAASELVLPAHFDYRLRSSSKVVGTAKDPGSRGELSLRPVLEFDYPTGTRPVPPGSMKLSPGAFQTVH